jgi:proteasome lid subunit RPN8/RPN11
MISIPPEIARQMQDHAFAWYPNECCGLLFAPAQGSTAIRAACLENRADKLHQVDPVTYPRTARTYYDLNPRQVAKAVDEAATRGERWLAVFHSHIDSGAYFSDEDKAAAAPDGVPVHPDVWQVVMEVHADGVRTARVYRWDGRDFAGVDLPGFARPRTP